MTKLQLTLSILVLGILLLNSAFGESQHQQHATLGKVLELIIDLVKKYFISFSLMGFDFVFNKPKYCTLGGIF